MAAYRTDSDGRDYESWTDVSDEIGRQMDSFIAADVADATHSRRIREWAADGNAALCDMRACGYEPQFDAADYQRWASEEVAR